MYLTCNALCMTQCRDLSFSNETLDALWTCLTFLCNIVLEDNQRTSFLSYMAKNLSADVNASSYSSCTNEDEAFLLNTLQGYAVPVKGYLSPVIFLLTIINNTLVCIVLLKPHMRSPVSVILVLIALSDTLTWVFALPVYIYFYATKRLHEWIPYNWCHVIDVFEYSIPTIFHTASVWLTMMLAIQRYICVCHPFKARSWCTMRNVIYGIIAIFLFATLMEIPSFYHSYIIETRRRSRLNPSVMVSGCVIHLRTWFIVNYRMNTIIYYVFRVIFISLIPCMSLIALNTLLILTMRKAITKRIELLRQNMKNESRRLRKNKSTTMMLVTVVIVTLIVEVPGAVFLTLRVFQRMLEINIISLEIEEMWTLFLNFFVQLSCPINFFIYCGMSKQFRDTFKSLFTCTEIPSVKPIHKTCCL